MKRVVLILAVSCLFVSKAYSQSIQFEPLSWRDALAKAKRENKMMFVEIYTTWCTYCRQMEQNIFPAKEAGAFYNNHFINLKYDALKQDGIQIRKSYALLGFPTFLYLDADGLVIKKTVGYQNMETFISNGSSAFSMVQNR